MNVALRRPMTVPEFLAWEERQELRYEFDGFQPVAMPGGTRVHAAIEMNLAAALTMRLRGSSCRPYGANLKIEVVGRIRYPDAFVTCTPGANASTVVQDPVVVFEILSPSTEHIDRSIKNIEYRDTRSIQRYVMLEQDRAMATVFSREGTEWIGRIVEGSATLSITEIGIELPLSEIYEGIAFEETEEAAES